MKKNKKKIPVDQWEGCYPSNWKGVILPEAIAHPAKFSSRLIRRIYDHAFEMGWVKPADHVIDPFGGIALGALDAMLRGLHWTGLELEPRFCELGGGSYPCDGFSKEDWRRYYFRPAFIQTLRKIQRLCPSCQAAMEPRKEYHKNGRGLKRVSIPSREAHIFRGNIPLWDHKFSRASMGWGSARLLNGDFRQLLNVIRSAQLVTSSPPYNLSMSQEHNGSRGGQRGTTPSEPGAFVGKYGMTPGQLEGLPMGDLDLALSSPPYSDRNVAGGVQGGNPASYKQNEGDTYGREPGQLGAMKDEGLDLALSSPPYAETDLHFKDNHMVVDGKLYQRPFMKGYTDGNYGKESGQLGAMKDEGFDASISSPVYPSESEGTPLDPAKYHTLRGVLKTNSAHLQKYGQMDGQMGEMQTGDFEIALSSPPFLQSSGGTPEPKPGGIIDEALHKRHLAGNAAADAYGKSQGQLSSMQDHDFDAAIGSPPFEDSLSKGTGSVITSRLNYARLNGISNSENVSPVDLERVGVRSQDEYGSTPGQLGADNGDSFWLAARAIVNQVFAALKPGGHAIWVVKMYVKDKQLVDFPDQWRRLCEASGFVTLHEHRAMLVHSKGKSYTLEGGTVEHKTESKSFFRRSYEKKGGHRIDWETVFCMEKPING